jgi:hypothetical protein
MQLATENAKTTKRTNKRQAAVILCDNSKTKVNVKLNETV